MEYGGITCNTRAHRFELVSLKGRSFLLRNMTEDDRDTQLNVYCCVSEFFNLINKFRCFIWESAI